jgi:pyridinium-3,5-bisthiocarboxylic acid mononucleotide nickel chelatase
VSAENGNTIAYADCFSGVSGDMLLAALLHAGLDRELLLAELEKLHLPGLKIDISDKNIQGMSGLAVQVDSSRHQELRTLPTIRALLEESAVSPSTIARSMAVFTRLAEAEAKVHGLSANQVHFHEVGALDTLVDIVGVVFGLEHLGVNRLSCSPLPLGRGFVRCAHGLLPLPAPAVCELLSGIPTYGIELSQELVTPTGAALIATLAEGFGTLPPMRLSAVGYGCGSRELDNGQPNLLRLFLGDGATVGENQVVEIIETNLDDWSPEGYPHLCELLFAAGALDVVLVPVQMKKGRPGFILQAMATPAQSAQVKEAILVHTSAIGLRFRREGRQTLPRKIILLATQWGEISAKQVMTPRGVVVYPEYEQCRRIALEQGVPLAAVYDEVRCLGRNEPWTG